MISFDELKEQYYGTIATDAQPILDLNRASPKREPLDRQEVRTRAAGGVEWHNNVRDLVASYISKGLTDDEIHTLTQGLTNVGYTIEDTRREIQVMIEGARRKGFDKSTKVKNNAEPFFERLGAIDLTPIPYLIEGLIPINSNVVIFGDPGSAKSFIGIDMACSIASGRAYHGNKVEQGSVLYIAGEGRRGLVQRAHGWCGYYEVDPLTIPFYISKHAVGLREEEQLAFVQSEIDEKVALGDSPVLVVIDTLARNFGGGDENSTKDMSEFISGVDTLNNQYGSASLIIHHSGVSDKSRSRGNTALKGALDAEFRSHKSGDFVSLSCTKMKDSDEPEQINFFLDSISVPSVGGEHIQTVVPIKRTDRVDRYRLTNGDAKLLKGFRNAYCELHGDYNSDDPISLQLEEWRPIFYKYHHGDNQDTKRKAFSRCRQTLTRKGILTVLDDIYTLTPKPAGRVRDIIRTGPDEHFD